MRALLILAVLFPLMGFGAYYASRGYLRAMRRRKHIDDLESENARYDDFLKRAGRSADRRARDGRT